MDVGDVWVTIGLDVAVRLDVPIVCVSHGTVIGGGMMAMLQADYRIAPSDATFLFPVTNLKPTYLLIWCFTVH